MKSASVLAAVTALTLGFAPAFGQDGSIGVKAPSPTRGATLPSLQYEATQPIDDNYPLGGVRILYDPAFFSQFSVPTETPTSTGRVGLAGWTTPNPPLGGNDGGFRDVSGWRGRGRGFARALPPRTGRRGHEKAGDRRGASRDAVHGPVHGIRAGEGVLDRERHVRSVQHPGADPVDPEGEGARHHDSDQHVGHRPPEGARRLRHRKQRRGFRRWVQEPLGGRQL